MSDGTHLTFNQALSVERMRQHLEKPGAPEYHPDDIQALIDLAVGRFKLTTQDVLSTFHPTTESDSTEPDPTVQTSITPDRISLPGKGVNYEAALWKTPTMSSHDLAKMLLWLPDAPVYTEGCDCIGNSVAVDYCAENKNTPEHVYIRRNIYIKDDN